MVKKLILKTIASSPWGSSPSATTSKWLSLSITSIELFTKLVTKRKTAWSLPMHSAMSPVHQNKLWIALRLLRKGWQRYVKWVLMSLWRGLQLWISWRERFRYCSWSNRESPIGFRSWRGTGIRVYPQISRK